jgi:hypothetical protein
MSSIIFLTESLNDYLTDRTTFCIKKKALKILFSNPIVFHQNQKFSTI